MLRAECGYRLPFVDMYLTHACSRDRCLCRRVFPTTAIREFFSIGLSSLSTYVRALAFLCTPVLPAWQPASNCRNDRMIGTSRTVLSTNFWGSKSPCTSLTIFCS
ncbi:MAG: hypothetical protein BJ554DRAFT_3985 [Olpidium bornovanus]|uniref:Uncharacterized protein n=1 Tax=Olpidium bornovanus TaxID=278681 RepID=A0A8H8DF48_9FUNG|nr:MAG: hypothetical protein BJ554DRAFT_3985 [Olpidium bornovanus]